MDDSAIDTMFQRFRVVASDVLGYDAGEREMRGEFSRDRWQALADAGYLAIPMQPRYGGEGLSIRIAVAATEGLAAGSDDSGTVYGLTSQLFGIQLPLQLLASETVRDAYLPELVRGRIVAAHAATEDGAGSDALSIETEATLDADGSYRLSGRKMYITNAPDADVALVFARTAPGRGPFVLTAFFVDLSSPGVSRGAVFEKLGLRTIRMGELFFDAVRVPAENVVGTEGGGLVVLTETAGMERAFLLTTALGAMQRSVDELLVWVRERSQFGRPIGTFQQVSSRIADITARLHVARLLIYDLATRVQRETSIRALSKEAAITKLVVSESYVQTQLEMLQLNGVRGYLRGSTAEQRLRDSVASTIYAGSSEVLRNMIAGLVGVPVDRY